jgi:alpha-1,2-mannosyltransferase
MESVTALAARAESFARSPRGRVVVLVLLCVFGVRHVSKGMGDFKTYQRAARRMVAGEPVYRLADPHRYLYAPVVTFFFLPLAVVPSTAGKILWFTLNVVLLVSIFRSTAALVCTNDRAPPGFYALLLLLSFRFIDNNIGHGQINILLLWLVLRADVLAAAGRYPLAGLAIAAAIATKIVPVVFLMQIIVRRQWRFALATLVGFALLMVMPFLWWGSAYPDVLRDWIAVVVDQAGHYEMGNKINQSISAFAYRLFQPYPDGAPLVVLAPGTVAAIVILIHGAFLLPLAWLSLRLVARSYREPHGPHGDELGLYVLYSTVAAPYSWKYYFVNLAFPVGNAARRLYTDDADARRFAIGLSVVFLLNLLAGLEILGDFASTLFQFWSFHFLAVAVLFALLLPAAFRVPERPGAG